MTRSWSGQNAVERGIDPFGLCSICAQPFVDSALHDDHVMPIGTRHADDGLILVRADDTFSACLQSEAPPNAEVFSPVPCAALTHASCNLSKGSTRKINRWRHWSLPDLVIAINKSDDRVTLPSLKVLPPSLALGWDEVQREAYDRGIEALRRKGHESGRKFRTTDELREAKRLERVQRRAEEEAAAHEMIQRAEAKLARISDWQEVRDAITRISTRLIGAQAAHDEAKAACGPPLEPDPNSFFDGCFEYDAASAQLRRWIATQRLARERRDEIYCRAVNAFITSSAGAAVAAQLASLSPEDRVREFNRHELQASLDRSPKRPRPSQDRLRQAQGP